jgi:hypothetical protein
MKALSSLCRQLRDAVYLLTGLAIYYFSKQTPQFAYQALIRLFCQTGGRANDLLSLLISRTTSPLDFGPATGVLGNLSSHELDDIVRSLKTDGYHVFPRQLPADVCARLVNYASTTECLIRASDEDASDGLPATRALYDPACPRGVRYDFTQQQVINIPEVQAIMADRSVLAVVQAYLGARPIADVSSMWWHTAYSNQPSSEAAQFYHFDLDRIRWLKVFIYLTEVGPDNGPHCFVEGSQRTRGIPSDLLSKGYARLTDEEILRHYPAARMKEFSAPAGTIIFEDTRGLHKGKAVQSGDRLMLQLQFSNSLFGAAYSPSKFENISNQELAILARLYPAIYANYLN